MAATTTQKTTWELARLAGCADPDSHDGRGFSADQGVEHTEGSAGAQFLRAIEDAVDDYGDELDENSAHEIADGAVPVYTHKLWSTFVDLAAYTEDQADVGMEDETDMTKLAGVCLFLIGERLAAALIEERADEDDEDEGEDAS